MEARRLQALVAARPRTSRRRSASLAHHRAPLRTATPQQQIPLSVSCCSSSRYAAPTTRRANQMQIKNDWGFLYNYLLTNAPWHVMRHRTGGCNDGYLIACPRCSAELFISTPSIGKDGNDSKHINEIQRRLIEFLWGSWARFAELYPHVAPACKDSFCTVETLVPGSVVAVQTHPR